MAMRESITFAEQWRQTGSTDWACAAKENRIMSIELKNRLGTYGCVSLTVLAFLITPPVGRAADLSFAEGAFSPIGGSAADSLNFEVAHLNDDEHLDVAVLSREEGGRIHVLHNDGTGALMLADTKEAIDFFFLDVPQNLVAGDLNGDGAAELVYPTLVFNETKEALIIVLVNRGDGTFEDAMRTIEDLPGEFGQKVALGDMDGDQDLDIVLSSPSMVFYNDGAGRFPTSRQYPEPDCLVDTLTLADMDGDGDLDIVAGRISFLIGCQLSGISISVNEGAQGFSRGPEFFPGGQAIVGDFDGDDDLDLAAKHSFPNSGIRVFINEGDLEFTTRGDFEHDPLMRTITGGDLNGDRVSDIAGAVAGEPVFPVYVNLGDGEITLDTEVIGEVNGTIRIADMDGDGRNDLVVLDRFQFPEGGNPSGITLFRNTTDAPVPGDIDEDGDLDLDDHSIFVRCMAGPAIDRPPADCTPDEFARADLDDDSHVDLADFGAFQAAFQSGS